MGTAGSAAAIGDDSGTTSASGNGAKQSFGNSSTDGKQSVQLSAVQGSLNKLCLGVPVKANIGSLVGLLNIAVQDIPKGDEPLSHILSDIPVLSGNGRANG
ncbi:hypothetical protein STRAU_2280 [Streptomyces aurantiacus JA 4570]|uniref:RdlA protein n=1 Tax=Streptomyces aurantiacus JA 4570 TaxID=1286094 RepID=S4ATH5_9ACTN|nr:hypothetical protein STRAU_2280 [Streptomyces aurantiacus JA 4570]